jgi:hypothetical protein
MALPLVKPLMKHVEMARSRFLYGLDRTRDDRLKWNPGEAALTPLELAGKTARFVGFMTHYFEHRAMPERPASPPPAPQSREEAKAALDASFRRMLEVLDGLTEADLQQTVTTPWRQTVALGEVLWTIPGIIAYHQGQLNYLQLAYGDTDPNIPPEWAHAADQT